MSRFSGLLLLVGVIGAGVWVCFRQSDGSKERTLRPDMPIEAAAFRGTKLAGGPGLSVAPGALLRAKAQRDRMFGVRPMNAGVAPASWTWIGPGNIGGRIRAVVIHPSQTNTMWIGSPSGGIWKTTNGGATWYSMDDFLPAMAVNCMAPDPSDPEVLFAGTGEGFAEWPEGTSNTAFVKGMGIFKTTNGGESWDQIPSTNNPDFDFVNRIAVSPTNHFVVLAATGTGIFRSTDGGNSWIRTFTGKTYDLRFHPTDGTKAIAGLRTNGAVYTLDGGLTWTASTGVTGLRTEVCYARSSPNTVFAAVSNNNFIKVYRSTNGGVSFALRTSGNGIGTYSAYNNALWVDPTNPNTIVFGGVNLYRSTDGGATHSQFFSGVHADHHILVNHPGFNGTTNRVLFFGCDGGVYRAADSNVNSVTNLNHNLGITQFYGAVINPISGVAFGGTQDNGTMRYAGNPQAWTSSFGGDGGFCATDPTNANYFYGSVQHALIFRSTNGGTSANYIYNSGTNDITDAGGDLTNFATHYVLDPNNANRMLVGCRRLWRTNAVKNPTVEWSAIKPTIEGGKRPGPPGGRDDDPPGDHFLGASPYNISTVTIAEGNSDLIYVGYNNGQVWKTTDGTVASPTWTRLDNNPGPLPDRWVSRIVVDHNNTNRVYVTFMGWNADNIWQSTDGGTTWAPIVGTGTGAMPAVPVSAFNIHRTEPGWLYAGTEIGLFTSMDDGASWIPEPAGPGLAPVEELHWQNDTTLVAVTHGRGVYTAAIDSGVDPSPPNLFSVVVGVLNMGQLPWLYLSDDKRIVASPSVTSAKTIPVRIQFRGRMPRAPVSEFRFVLEASVTVSGLQQSIDLFNFSQNRWVTVDARNASLSDTVVQVSVTQSPGQYRNEATAEVWARVSYVPGVFDPAFWSAKVDRVSWASVR